MAGRGRSPARAALSRLPGWVTVLGVVLVLGELTGGAALLAAGRGGTVRPHGATGSSGVMQTVVLQVDGGHAGCHPPDSCGPQVSYRTPAGRGVIFSAIMPFIKTVRVPAGQTVTLDADAGTQDRATCSITVDGTELTRITAGHTWGTAICEGAMLSRLAGGAAGTRTVVLQVAAHPGDTVTYSTPAGHGHVVVPAATPPPGYTEATSTLTKKVAVRDGGIVTIHAVSPTGDAITSTITVDGATVSQVHSGASSDSWVRIP